MCRSSSRWPVFAPPAFTGHSSAAGNHDAAVISLALHLVGVAVWAGELVFVLIVAARQEKQAVEAVRRFSPLAAWALLAVAASGIVNVVVRLPSPGDAFTSRYGLMILTKALALAALGGIGWWHRRRTLPALENGERRGFVRLASGELLLMAAAVGLAVGLSRTPVPGSGDAVSPTEELLGFPMPPPLGDFPWTGLFTQWHFDPLFAFGTAAAGLLYPAGVRKLRARGDEWPIGRTVSWMLGLAVAVVATMSGLAVYGGAAALPRGWHSAVAVPDGPWLGGVEPDRQDRLPDCKGSGPRTRGAARETGARTQERRARRDVHRGQRDRRGARRMVRAGRQGAALRTTVDDRLRSAVMRSQAEHTARGAWTPTRIAALCPALLTLLVTLVVCLGFVSHGDSGPVGTSLTSASSFSPASSLIPVSSVSSATSSLSPSSSVASGPVGPVATAAVGTPAVDAPAGHHRTAGAQPADCPYGGDCCGRAAHGVRAVLAAPVQPAPAVLPRTPRLPAPGVPSRCAGTWPTGHAPDLHVLQVQRT